MKKSKDIKALVQSVCPFSLLSFQGYDAINKSKNLIQKRIDGYSQCSFRQEVSGKWLLGYFYKEIISGNAACSCHSSPFYYITQFLFLA